ncbi:MAG: hypothetical protein BMS9Abin13_047 [Patescibacteria group bacterium]|nr:MAG: hypothetical protein BMS9Abin13_047 [Patescibacteria group bacterium]
MKKTYSFVRRWIVWFILAFAEVDDSGEYCQGMTIVFIAIGLTALTVPFLIIPVAIGWSWLAVMCGVGAYLLVGIVYNEFMNGKFGHRVF